MGMSSPGVAAQQRSHSFMALSLECHTTAEGLSAPCTMPLPCSPASVFTTIASTALFCTSSGALRMHDGLALLSESLGTSAWQCLHIG